jgi:alpha-tubulin suppressor-like RCC1 family protein
LLNGKDGADWCLISCGGAHTLALSADSSGSQFFTWGLGEHGQLGHDENVDRNTPERVQNVDLGLIKVSAGLRHTMMFDGEFLYAWYVD